MATGRFHRISLVAVCCLAAGTALWTARAAPAPASAVPPWLPPTVIGHSFASKPQIAVDASGEAVALWQHVTGRGVVIESVSRPPHGAWSAPVTLTRGTSNGIPRIAVDDSGEAVAVWEDFTYRGVVIESASRPGGGAWSAPSVLSLRVQNSARPQIAIDGAGEAVVLWERYTGRSSITIIESASRPPGAAWSASTVLSEKEQAAPTSAAGQEAQIAVNASGEAVAAWKQTDGGDSSIIESASRPPGGAWSTPAVLTDKGGRSAVPRLAIDAAGEAVAAWVREDGDSSAIESASRPPGGVWSTPTAISHKGRIGSSVATPRVLIAPAGEAVAVWPRFGVAIESASRPPGGAWSAPTVITKTRAGSITVPQVAMNAAGEAIAVWRHIHRGRNDPSIQSASRPPRGAWSAPVTITGKPRINAPRVAIDGAGEAIAVWEGFTGKASVIESASRPSGGA